MHIKTYILLLALLGIAFAGLSCQEESPVDALSGSDVAHSRRLAPRRPKEIDLSAALGQASVAFRRDGNGLRSTGPAYRVHLEEGRFTLGQSSEARGITFETIAMGRGGDASSLSPSSSVGADGSARVQRHPFVERLRNTPEGVAQSWELAELPPGAGDFVVRVAVQGQSYLTETDGGLHFIDKETGERTRYGHATWIDRNGRETRVRARFVEGAIELRVPEPTVVASSYPAVLDPMIGPEFEVDRPISIDGSTSFREPSVGGDTQGGSLTVWESGGDVYGARLSPEGELLDPFGFLISAARATQTRPDVAFNGTHYLVVWQDYRSGDFDVYGARVSPDGTVVDTDGFVIHEVPDTQESPTVASDGTDFFVTFEDHREGEESGIYGTRVLADGSVPSRDPVQVLSSTELGDLRPAVTHTGSVYFIAWHSAGNVFAARVTSGGELMDTAPLVLTTQSTSYGPVDIASSGSEALVVWRHRPDPMVPSHDIRAVRLRDDGTAVDPDGIVVRTSSSIIQKPSVAFDGGRYLVTWQGYPQSTLSLSGAHVETDGTVGSPMLLLSNGDSIDLAFDGVHFVAAFLAGSVRVAQIDTEGSLATPGAFGVSDNGTGKENPAVATDGTDFLVVWSTTRDTIRTVAYDTDIYGAIVASDGTVLSNFPICTTIGHQFRPEVLFNGTDYLVAWSDSRENVYGTLVTTSGEVLSPNGFPLSSEGEYDPSLASDGSQVLLVFQDNTDGAANVYGQRLELDGTPIDSDRFAITADTTPQSSPMVAFGGSNFLVVWRDARDGPTTAIGRTFGSRVSPSGQVLDGLGFAISNNTDVNELVAGVTFDGTNFLVLWQHTTLREIFDLFGARVDTNGTVVGADGPVFGGGGPIPAEAAIAYDGIDSVVVFSELLTEGRYGLFGSRVDGTGAIRDPEGFEISDSVSGTGGLAVAFNDFGLGLVAYSSERDGRRIHANLFTANCTPLATTDETCDGIDDDCDGQVDEDYPSTPTTCGNEDCPGTGEITCIARNVVNTCAVPGESCAGDPGSGGEGNGGSSSATGGGASSGDGDAIGDGDGDGDAAGDGDGDPTQTGDGDSAASSSDRDADAESDSGGCDCGCKIGGSSSRPSAPWACLTLLSLVWLRRARRS